MGKPKKNGGKKHRRGKNLQITHKIDLPDDDQYFGYITKILGNGFFTVNYYKPIIKEKDDIIEWLNLEKKGKIRGKMVRKVWINNNDYVLITEREFETNTVDIISKLSIDNIEYLKRQNIDIPNINNMFNDEILFTHIDEDIDTNNEDIDTNN